MNEYRTRRGLVVRVGDEFCDDRKSNVRTLRIDRLQVEDYGVVRAFCTVIRQEYNGAVTTPMRATDMVAERFGTFEFKPAGKGLDGQPAPGDEAAYLFTIGGDQ
ncbi:hypothetical protein [Nocardia acidivorans]|uniref:hypothetical protein n=1 Tax=Nocardia acidivorans TaxID=404580 RepID=UPI00082B0490|nr:hypothetical protein [Nocardia acidivorans]